MTDNIEHLKIKPRMHPVKLRLKNLKEKSKPLLKVIIRRLPPTMTEEDFLKQIDPIPDHEFYYFVAADWSLGAESTCRAYITFKKQEDLFIFKDKFDGYVFVDNKGSEYPAIVEFAAFQNMPKNRSRKFDVKENSIESDPHFIGFVEKLNLEYETKNELKLEFTLQTNNKETRITSTPLLQYLASKKQERRDDRKKKSDEKKRQRDDERHGNKKITIAQKSQMTSRDDDNNKGGSGGNNKSNTDLRKDPRHIGAGSGSSAGAPSSARGTSGNGRGSDQKDSRSKRRLRRREEREIREKERAQNYYDRDLPETKILKIKNNNGEEAISIEKKPSQNIEENIIKRDDSKPKENRRNNMSRRERMRAKIEGISRKFETNNSNKIPEKKEEYRLLKPMPKTDKSDKAAGDKNNVEEESVGSIDGNEADNFQQANTSRRCSRSSSSTNEKAATGGTAETKESRRIRNKDRPSIAIYQPGKLRLAGSNNVESIKDKSNSSLESDNINKRNDAIDKEQPEVVKKKFTRYSERRAYRTGKTPKEFSSELAEGKLKPRIPDSKSIDEFKIPEILQQKNDDFVETSNEDPTPESNISPIMTPETKEDNETITTDTTPIVATPPTETVATPPTETVVTPTETVATPPTETVVTPPTETVATPPTETVVTPPTETVATPPTETVATTPTEAAATPPTETVVTPSSDTVASSPTSEEIILKLLNEQIDKLQLD